MVAIYCHTERTHGAFSTSGGNSTGAGGQAEARNKGGGVARGGAALACARQRRRAAAAGGDSRVVAQKNVEKSAGSARPSTTSRVLGDRLTPRTKMSSHLGSRLPPPPRTYLSFFFPSRQPWDKNKKAIQTLPGQHIKILRVPFSQTHPPTHPPT